MGRFGRHLSKRLMELGNDVMIVDENEALISELAPSFTDAQIGDCTKETVIRSFGVSNFDACFVAIGENFQSSLEITSLLKENGAKKVISKANTDIQAKFLLKCGADEVVYPEKQLAERLSSIFSADNVFDYVELTPGYAIFEIPILQKWAGHSIVDVNVRSKYKVNILAIKKNGELLPLPGADYIFCENDHIMVMGKNEDVLRLTDKI